MTKWFNLTNTRNNFPQIIAEVSKGSQVVITRRGKPTAIIIGINDNQLETWDIMKDKELMKKIKIAKEDIKKGRIYTYQETFGEKQCMK